MIRHFATVQELATVIDVPMGPGDWVDVDQARIDHFAQATGDDQWIHVDPERSARESPFGAAIAQGNLTLGLIGALQPSVYTVAAALTVNCGFDRVRYLAPVPAGSRVRLVETIRSVEPSGAAFRVSSDAEIQLAGADRPAAVAVLVYLYHPKRAA